MAASPSPNPQRPPLGPATTRLAPSPTGALHLGNARTFLITWAIARRLGWRILLRIEDLDTPRVKPGAVESLADTLGWLGLDWDPPVFGPSEVPLVQSRDLEPYRAAVRTLAEGGLAYPCELTRAQIESAASAPQEGSHEIPFPASLRSPIAGAQIDFDTAQRDARRNAPYASITTGPTAGANWRFYCPEGLVEFADHIAGPSAFAPAETIGDFILWTKRDHPSYQLAVVVDDHRQGVNRVIRGEDLRESAARQLLLYRALGLTTTGTQLGAAGGGEPEYWHVPLVVGSDGRRLAKRHGDTRVDVYRERGVPREALIGLIAHWSIPGAAKVPMTPEEFKARFDPATMPRTQTVFTLEDDAWLLSHASP